MMPTVEKPPVATPARALSPLREDRLPHPLLHWAAHLFWRVTRGLTLGVRVVALDAAGRVFLIRHGYTPGWHLPGGGVEAGETAMEALIREMREEGNLILSEPARLHAIHFNGAISRRDHVLVYVARGVTQTAPRAPDREIVESGFFSLDALPDGVTRATRARLSEVLNGVPTDPHWRPPNA